MFVTVQDVEDRFSAARLAQVFDFDLDNVADELPLTTAVIDANAEIWARLCKKGYSEEQLRELARDETIRRASATIVMEFGAFAKPELINDNGTTFYTPMANNARKLIDDIAAATLRPRSEKTAGAPATVQAKMTTPSPEFHVAPSEDRPRGRGIF